MNALQHLKDNWNSMSDFDRKRFLASNMHLHGECIELGREVYKIDGVKYTKQGYLKCTM